MIVDKPADFLLETISLVFIPFACHTQRMRLQNTTDKNDAAATRSPSFTETGIVKDKWMARGGKMCLLTCIKGREMIIVHNSADRWNPCKYWASKKSRREGREAVDVRLFTTSEMFSADFPILSLYPRREMSPTRWCSFPFLQKKDEGLLLLLTPACVLIPATASQVKTPFGDQGTSHWPLTEKCAEFAFHHFL